MTTDPDKLISLNARWLQEQEHELWPDRSASEFGHRDCRACGPGPLGRWQIPGVYRHVFYTFTKFRDDYGISYTERRRCLPDQAKVVSSEIEDKPGWHTVMLDLDLNSYLVESSTRGHYHLYVDMPLRWREYKRLLRALMKAGLIERGFYKASVKRRATHLRPPWLDKESLA
jgi:hypothetical protein